MCDIGELELKLPKALLKNRYEEDMKYYSSIVVSIQEALWNGNRPNQLIRPGVIPDGL